MSTTVRVFEPLHPGKIELGKYNVHRDPHAFSLKMGGDSRWVYGSQC
jgi:hypothetical protein